MYNHSCNKWFGRSEIDKSESGKVSFTAHYYRNEEFRPPKRVNCNHCDIQIGAAYQFVNIQSLRILINKVLYKNSKIHDTSSPSLPLLKHALELEASLTLVIFFLLFLFTLESVLETSPTRPTAGRNISQTRPR